MVKIKKAIQERVINISKYIHKTKKTIREVAKEFNVSKSTVHKDIHERLLIVDKPLYKKVEKIMKEHIDTRHIRGGESTKKKYAKVTKR